MYLMLCLCFLQEGYRLEGGEKYVYLVIITVLGAHRGYASFNFTLLSFPSRLHSLLPFFLSNPSRQCWQQRYDRGGPAGARGKWSANGTLSPIGHLLTLHSPAAHSVVACAHVCVRLREGNGEADLHQGVPFLSEFTPLLIFFMQSSLCNFPGPAFWFDCFPLLKCFYPRRANSSSTF